LTVIDISTVTVGSLRRTIEETEFFGFPCVLNSDSQLLTGFITRKDIQFVLGERTLASCLRNIESLFPSRSSSC